MARDIEKNCVFVKTVEAVRPAGNVTVVAGNEFGKTVL